MLVAVDRAVDVVDTVAVADDSRVEVDAAVEVAVERTDCCTTRVLVCVDSWLASAVEVDARVLVVASSESSVDVSVAFRIDVTVEAEAAVEVAVLSTATAELADDVDVDSAVEVLAAVAPPSRRPGAAWAAVAPSAAATTDVVHEASRSF